MYAKTTLADVTQKIVPINVDQKIPSSCLQKISLTEIDQENLANLDQKIFLVDISWKLAQTHINRKQTWSMSAKQHHQSILAIK